MNIWNKTFTILVSGLLLISVTGCAPEVGSEAWCNDLKEKPKGEWTANEAGEFAKSCIFK
ncbi:MAG: DUF3012 domain-containing protein [Gammaproteobacteria bacterium]|nr:DUF3012 domain-containing protein [Gammaproteobacteria bacterium]